MSLLTMKNYIAPFRTTPELKRNLGEHEISRSGPWGTSAVSKGAHSGVRNLPLRSHPQGGDIVQCGHLQMEGEKSLRMSVNQHFLLL